MFYAGYLMLLARQVVCKEYSECYNDVNICLWTGSQLSQSAAETACQQRNNSFLPRVANSSIQDKLKLFRSHATTFLGNSGFWIDVRAIGINSWHWIDNSSLAGLFAFISTVRGVLLCLSMYQIKSFYLLIVYREHDK